MTKDIVEREIRKARRRFMIYEFINGALVLFFIAALFWFVREIYF